jgi:A/G-specific adenine glycosylase
MLQQTVVATVEPYFRRFLERFPDVVALAAASEDDVTAAWSGLGYYARARNLAKAARAVVERHAGALPADEEALRALPGIGPYTAAAVAAIAFGARTFALDGNGARVTARLFGVHDSIDKPATRDALRARGRLEVPPTRAGDFNQAVMELGATVCTPRAPRCGACPLARKCRAHATGAVARLPVRTPKRRKVVVRVACCACVDAAGRVLLVRRQAGLLAGTWALPTIEVEGDDAGEAARAAVREIGVRAGRLVARGAIRHVFTHRDVTADVFRTRAAAARVRDGQGTRRWLAPEQLGGLGVSSFTRKTLAAALDPHPAPGGAGLTRKRERRRSGGKA